MKMPIQSAGVNLNTSTTRIQGNNTEDIGNANTNKSQPHRLTVPGIVNYDIGLGDVIKKITSTVGINTCGGCERRAAALNQWLVISPEQHL